MITTYIGVFLTSFANVFFRAFQQLNVMNHEIKWIIPTSFSLAACEVFIVFNAAQQGWGWIVLPLGLGGGLGCITSMTIHKKIREGNWTVNPRTLKTKLQSINFRSILSRPHSPPMQP